MSEVLSLYEILKASKTGIASDTWTALAGMNWGGKDSGAEVKELTGIPPLSIRSNGTMLLDYLISGNMSQSGTPTPTTPIQPQGTGNKTANLLFSSQNQTIGSTLHITQTIGNSNFILNKDVSQSDTSANIDIDVTLPAGKYTVSVIGLNLYNNDYDRVFIRDDNSTIVVQNVQVNHPRSFTLTETTHIYRLTVVAASQSTYNNTNIQIMLNSGGTALPYQPSGYKIPISSGGENLFDPDILLEAVGWTKDNNIYSGYSANLHSAFNSFDKCIPVDAAVVNMSVMFRYANLTTPFFIVFWYTDGTSTNTSKIGKAGEWTYLSVKSNSDKTLKGVAFSYGTNDLVELKDIMLSRGSTALPYEPYNRTTTPIYLGEVQTTRKVKKYEFTGQENWNRVSNGAYYLPSTSNPISNYKFISADISINSHFPSQGVASASLYVNDGKSAFFYWQSSNTREYYIAARDIPTLEDFKAFLAQQYANGTPVTVWYVLATPTTGIVNEPLRKIGDYADTLSMEQAGVQIPTNRGNTVIDVETTLKPSEMYIKYQE